MILSLLTAPPGARPGRKTCLAAVLAASAFCMATLACQAAEERATFANSLAPLPVQANTINAAPTATATARTATTTASRLVATNVSTLSAAQLAAPLEFQVALRMRDLAEFEQRVASGETVPFAEVESKYLPLQSDYDAVRQWLVGQGFTVTMDDARRLGIFVRGTTAQIKSSLQVNMQSVTVAGVTYAAASTAPSLPVSIAGAVLGINGLQPYIKPRRHSHLSALDGTSPQANYGTPYTVPAILKGYDATGLGVGGTTLTGANQKIAILIDTFPNQSDVTQFWINNGIDTASTVAAHYARIEQVNVPNGTLDPIEGEETLDVEWSSSIAPGAGLRVYESDDLQFVDINKCLSQIATDVSGSPPAQPLIHALSISLGAPETDVSSSTVDTEHGYFVTITNGGVSIFVSSGDSGSDPDGDGMPTPEYESSDPSVTGVGGTSLTLNSVSGAWAGEVAWPDSGGGTSQHFPAPSWQVGTGIPTGNTMRLAPDVAAVGADTSPGYLYFKGTVYNVWGTSWSAPTWAALTTLMNQGRALVGKPSLGLLNPRVYPLNQTGIFHDIISGSNGDFTAATGYDEVTGLGSPDVSQLLTALMGPTISGFTPAVGAAGTSVVITGTDFYGVTSVTFNGVAAASYVVNGATQITAVAPNGVAMGPIGVTALSETAASSTNFTIGKPDLTITATHTGSFTQADAADSYTLTVSNVGTAATGATVNVADTLPSGLTATALAGTGWTVAADHLSAKRTDPLAAGSSYPALTLTVSVSSTAGASVTNVAAVSGGGETNTSNDTASDPTTIVALTPSQSWRYQNFGTTADTGNAADTANPSGDGIDNLTKYALGLNPLAPALSTVTTSTTGGYLSLTVPKNVNATDLIYAVQVTSDPTDPASWDTRDTTVEEDDSTTLTVRDNTPVGMVPQRFIRLQITRP